MVRRERRHFETVPRVDRSIPGGGDTFLRSRGGVLASPHGQAVFFRAEKDFEVPPHAHGAQWGIVASGNLELTVEGVARSCKPGDTYSIGAGETHSARLGAGTCVIDVFQDPDRYEPKAR